MSFESCLPWGWNDFLESFYLDFCQSHNVGVQVGRVLWDSHGLYGVHCPQLCREFMAKCAGRLLHQAQSREDLPAVGDWLCLEGDFKEGEQRIVHVLPRRTCLKRKEAGKGKDLQVFAAQMDEVWIVTSCNQDLSPERLERALLLVSESGARARILLSKSDLVNETHLHNALMRLQERLGSTAIHSYSVRTGQGLEQLHKLLAAGESCVVIGSSGVGKSTLINCLLGSAQLEVQAVREEDAKGRHTTTGRSLHRMPQSGALLIDTPGTRELQLFSDEKALDATFADIAALSIRCKYSDCRHESEDHCAVKTALENSQLQTERWENYLKLGREMAFQERRKHKALQSMERKRWAKISVDAKLHKRVKTRGKS